MSMNFEKHTQKANEIIKELTFELGDDENTDKAVRVLRAALHALRNRLPIEESMQLISQLPMYIKAIYVDGWKISKQHFQIKSVNDFLNEVYLESARNNFNDFPNVNSIHEAVVAVFNVLRHHVSEGEIEDIKATMPKELKILWEEKQKEKVYE